MANNSYRSFKTKNKMSPKTMLSLTIAALGFLSFIFLAGTGIVFVYNFTSNGVVGVTLGNVIWGGGNFAVGLCPGLVVAFFLTIAASLFVLGVSSFQYIAIISMLMFIASGVLTLCAVPLCNASETLSMIGRGTAYLGWGGYAYGILNILCGVGCFFCTRGD